LQVYFHCMLQSGRDDSAEDTLSGAGHQRKGPMPNAWR